MGEPVRQPLQVLSSSRDSNRTKGPWAINCFPDENKIMKRPGFSLNASGTTPGQGLFNYTTSIVSVQNDVLKVGASSFPL